MMSIRNIGPTKRIVAVGAVIGFAVTIALTLRSFTHAQAIDPNPSPRSQRPVEAAENAQTGPLPIAAKSATIDAKPLGLPADSNPLWAIPLGSLTETRERPVFSPSRRPPAVALPPSPAPIPASTRPQRPPLMLVGAIAGPTEGTAIFFDNHTKSVIRLKTGESHSGWTLNLVAKREATLLRGKEVAVLTLLNAAEQTSPPQ